MRVLICGDRNWSDYNRILDIVRGLIFIYGDVSIIQGNADGADIMARRAAIECGIPHYDYPAIWSDLDAIPCVIRYRTDGMPYNVLAGPIRNQKMLDDGRPDMVIGFHHNIKSSKGTKDMINRSMKAGIRTLVIDK